MSVEIAWKQNILVTDFHLLKSLLVVFGLGLQAFICEFSRQNICSVFKQIAEWVLLHAAICTYFRKRFSYISMEKLKEQFP